MGLGARNIAGAMRRKDKAHAMESVARSLSFGSSVFPSEPKEAHTGFEPVPPP